MSVNYLDIWMLGIDMVGEVVGFGFGVIFFVVGDKVFCWLDIWVCNY